MATANITKIIYMLGLVMFFMTVNLILVMLYFPIAADEKGVDGMLIGVALAL